MASTSIRYFVKDTDAQVDMNADWFKGSVNMLAECEH